VEGRAVWGLTYRILSGFFALIRGQKSII
jgi:hypothetical protein